MGIAPGAGGGGAGGLRDAPPLGLGAPLAPGPGKGGVVPSPAAGRGGEKTPGVGTAPPLRIILFSSSWSREGQGAIRGRCVSFDHPCNFAATRWGKQEELFLPRGW